MEKTLYADYNATTPLGPLAKAEMQKAFEVWGNPSSAHRLGREATELLESSRELVAKACGVSPSEVVFTSGGSEANALALSGCRFLKTDFRLVTSGIEHSSQRGIVSFLKSTGAQITKIKVNREGSLDMAALETALQTQKPELVSLMAANNETGVVYPIQEIRELCTRAGALLHTDAVQALGKLAPLHWNSADLISISAHKIHGPKGVGALIIKKNLALTCTQAGGTQEMKRRGGTQNMVGICGFAGACEELPKENELILLNKARVKFEEGLRKELDGVSIQGESEARLANTSNVRFHGIGASVLLSALDLEGVCVSSGSACSSGSITPSPILIEMGLSEDEAKECLRFSFSHTQALSEIDAICRIVVQHVKRIRARRSRA